MPGKAALEAVLAGGLRTLVLGACLGLFAGCGGDDESGSDEPTEAAQAAASEDEGAGGEGAGADEASAQARAALEDMRVHLDLLATAHLADVEHRGLYVDFGTPARMHFTMGRWNSGFLTDVSAESRDFTRIGTDARMWFHLDEAGPITLRFRGRAQGSRRLNVYVNGQRAGMAELPESGVGEVDLAVEGALVREGENALMIRASDARTIGGEEVAAELDSLWVFEGDAPEGELHPPRYAEMVRELELGGRARESVVLRAPSTIRWYVEVPEGGQLSLGYGASGAASLRVTVTPEGGEARTLLEAEAPSEGWADRLLDLGPMAGEVVRLEVAVTGEAEAVGLAGPAVVVPMPEPLAQAQARSAIVLLIDTLRADKLRAYDPDSRVVTPTLDAFAEQGAVFEHAQAPENWTKPSVASVLTSLTPMTHNTKEQSSSLPQSALMVSEVFQDNDFATASFIANGYVSDHYGFDQGWDHYTNYIREARSTEAANVFREALAWIEEHRDERFFAYIQTIDPHVPYDPPGELLARYDAGEYDGPISPRSTGNQLEAVKRGEMTLSARDHRRLEALHDGEITYHDQEMGRFVERLRELGVYDDVIFVVTSDHGEEFDDHGSYGHGHSIFQELIHVPLMMRWPGVVEQTRIGPTVSTMDIAPTILEATGVEIPQEFEGSSLLGTARGVARPGRPSPSATSSATAGSPPPPATSSWSAATSPGRCSTCARTRASRNRSTAGPVTPSRCATCAACTASTWARRTGATGSTRDRGAEPGAAPRRVPDRPRDVPAARRDRLHRGPLPRVPLTRPG